MLGVGMKLAWKGRGMLIDADLELGIWMIVYAKLEGRYKVCSNDPLLGWKSSTHMLILHWSID